MLQNVLPALPMSHPFWTMISRSAKNQCLEEFSHWKLVCREVLSYWNEMQAAPIAQYCTLIYNIPLSLLLQTIANYSTIAPLIHTIEMRCTLRNANRICFITPNILNFWPTFRIAFRTTIKCILDCFTNIKFWKLLLHSADSWSWGQWKLMLENMFCSKITPFLTSCFEILHLWANISKQNANCKLIPFISFHSDNELFISHVFTKWFDAFISGFCLFITRQVKKQTTTCQRRGRC